MDLLCGSGHLHYRIRNRSRTGRDFDCDLVAPEPGKRPRWIIEEGTCCYPGIEIADFERRSELIYSRRDAMLISGSREGQDREALLRHQHQVHPIICGFGCRFRRKSPRQEEPHGNGTRITDLALDRCRHLNPLGSASYFDRHRHGDLRVRLIGPGGVVEQEAESGIPGIIGFVGCDRGLDGEALGVMPDLDIVRQRSNYLVGRMFEIALYANNRAADKA